ncbi:MAG: T9SS type A sorting domain-containing protein, partial [Bacteroidota bacterium]
MKSLRPLVLLIGAAFLFAPLQSANAQSPFTSCPAATGQTFTVILPDPANLTIGGTQAQTGDEIALYNANGDCAGVGVYDASSTSSIAATIDDQAPGGNTVYFTDGDQLYFQVWDNSSNTHYDENATVSATFDASQSAPVDNNGIYNSGESLSIVQTMSANGALPVELTAFDALLMDRDVILRWETATETVNAGFEVQMQTEADQAFEAWTNLSFVEGRGTTAEAQAYEHRVTDLAPGLYRFRLKQVDFDGTFEYHPEVEVTVESPETFMLSSAYPNPFNPQTTFTLALQSAQNVTVEVYNTLGQRVAQLYDGRLEANRTHQFTFEARDLASGLYILSVRGDRFAQS